MNPLLPEEEQMETPQFPQITPPLDTEQEVVQLVVEEVASEPKEKIRAKTNINKKTLSKSDRKPPEVSGVFLSDEDRRMLRKMNQIMIDKLGIRKNNSFRV